MINLTKLGHLDIKKLLAVGIGGLAVFGFFLQGLPSFSVRHSAIDCQQIIQPNNKLKSDQIAQFLTKVKSGESRDKVRSIVKEPYCKLANAKIRTGVESERDMYALEDQVIEGESDAKLIVLYEDSNYAGYRFMVR
jgi:hypothetical protein